MGHVLRWKTVATLAGAVIAMHPAALRAQRGSVVGLVVGAMGEIAEERQLSPLTRAEVRLTRVDSVDARAGRADPVHATHPDSVGAFAFLSLEAGAYRLDVHHVGYEPFADTLIVPAGEAVRVRVAMRRVVPRLERVVTTAAAGYRARLLQTSGFRERQQRGFGHFIDAHEIARLQPPSVLSLLRPYLRGCTMMFVNGARAAVPQGLTVAELVGVEIYRRNLQAPGEFQNPFSDCGSIALWTAIAADDRDSSAVATP
jgi:hypothetical protein